ESGPHQAQLFRIAGLLRPLLHGDLPGGVHCGVSLRSLTMSDTASGAVLPGGGQLFSPARPPRAKILTLGIKPPGITRRPAGWALEFQQVTGRSAMSRPELTGVLETALYVADLARAVAFYERVFGFPKLVADARICAFDVAQRQVLLLFQQG